MSKPYHVAALFALAVTAPSWGEDADIVFTDGAVYTVDAHNSWAEAVAVKDKRIIFVGSSDDVSAYIGRDTKVVDLKGKMMMPGFQDVHIHPVSAGIKYNQCPLFDLKGIDAMVAKVRECDAKLPKGAWLQGGGFLLVNFAPSGLPDKKILDAVVPDRPAFFYSSDGHSMWVNSKALEVAGITADTPDPENGRIDRYPGSMEPSGSLQEDGGFALITKFEPPYQAADYAVGLNYSLKYLNSLGITAMQDADVDLNPGTVYSSLDTYRDFDARDALTMHVVASLWWEAGKPMAPQLARFDEARKAAYGKHLKANTVKIMQDGVVEVETAAMIEPYSDRPDGFRGDSFNTPEMLNDVVTELDKRGYQVHFHAIGDRAIRESLDAVEAAQKANGKRDARHHMSHIQIWDPADIPRMAALDVVANYQALWAVNDTYITELTLPHIGEERAKYLYPIASTLKAGGKLALGSDWSVSTPDPFDAIEVAVTRLDPHGADVPPLLADEAISLADAVRGYTMGSAYVNFLDQDTGSVEVGKLADLIVLDQNIFSVAPSEISETKVLLTLFEGKAVHGSLAALK